MSPSWFSPVFKLPFQGDKTVLGFKPKALPWVYKQLPFQGEFKMRKRKPWMRVSWGDILKTSMLCQKLSYICKNIPDEKNDAFS